MIRESKLMKLPVEILVSILEILYYRGKLKPKYLRVCKLFYFIAYPLIYRAPRLKSSNFFSFVESISANKRGGAEYIQELDLSGVIQSGKNAFVSKLLKRTKKQLQVFVAPQASFGLAPLLSLKNCSNLKILDLRLVSETLNLSELFNSIRSLQNLTHLSFPRSSVAIGDYTAVAWPPKLSYLRLSGGISDDFLLKTEFPPTITQLEFAHCPHIKEFGFQLFIRKMGSNLKTLKVQYPMPGLRERSLDPVFYYCKNLLVLEVAVDYVSSTFFDEENLSYLDFPRPLKTLYIESSGMLGTSTRLDPIDLAVALNDERLPKLKNIRCTAKLGWDPKSEYVSFIVDALDERGGGIYIGY
ncbi:F-box protein [[Candida] railenensis]|uniref:F-box protein n=1 Tax=[Candida] railenensis TaxID=45579 RepID=A0A9P0QW75_9ASCO|nr:F-box protein [[Candida] railenensis]